MVKDILSVAATIVILAIGTMTVFWGVLWFEPRVATAQSAKPAVAELEAVKLRGTIKAIDKDKRTVTLVGPQGGTLTLAVRDPQKLDVVKVGDPVVATYYEALVIQVRPAGSATPGVSVTDALVSSKPGENPAGAVESQVTVTAAVASVDAAKGTVTIKGLQGDTETVKARDPKMLTGVKSGDLVQLTYRRAFAVALDRPAGN
jgi:Cu/Ag efflux protein CusF